MEFSPSLSPICRNVERSNEGDFNSNKGALGRIEAEGLSTVMDACASHVSKSTLGFAFSRAHSMSVERRWSIVDCDGLASIDFTGRSFLTHHIK